MRFLSAAVFAVAAVGVGVANSGGADRVWYLPFEKLVPSLQGDYPTQGAITVALFASLSLFSFVRAWRSSQAE